MDQQRLTYSVEEAGEILGISRSSAYEAAYRGDIPTLRIGKRILVPRIPFEKMLGKESKIESLQDATNDGESIKMPRGCGS
jgi:excisionase family DNA binding protein